MVDLEDALADSNVIHEDLGTNASYTWELTPDAEAVEAAFSAADHVVSGRYIQQRLIPAAMEPRGVVAVPAPFGGDITIYSATQIPHILKVMVALTLGLPEQKVRVVAPSVGGGFGSKLNVYAEEIMCTALALRHGPLAFEAAPADCAMACRCAGPRAAPRRPRPPFRAGGRFKISSWPPMSRAG